MNVVVVGIGLIGGSMAIGYSTGHHSEAVVHVELSSKEDNASTKLLSSEVDR